MPDADVVVLGAGPAGAAAACDLARLNRQVIVIDPDLPVSARVETLSANGERLARAMGLSAALDAAALGRAAVTRMHWRAEPETVDHADGGPLLLDRRRLHVALRREAEARGVEFVTGRARAMRRTPAGVEAPLPGRTVTARVAIDARGRRGRADTCAPVLAALPFHGRMTAGAAAELLLEALPQGWLWAARGPGGEVAGAMFLPAQQLSGTDARARRHEAEAILAAATLVRGMTLHTVGRPQRADPVAVDDPVALDAVLRIGDRALAQSPISSQGISQALRSAGYAAAAANSMIETDDAEAAHSFLRERHAAARRAAERALARIYADQSRWPHAAWLGEIVTSPPTNRTASDGRALSLVTGLHRAAVLRDGRIGWAQALTLPASGQSAAYFGGLGADQVAAMLAEPAPLATLSARLGRIAPPAAVHRILTTLLAEGALGPVDAPVGEGPRI